jgi:hypothetical protein
MCMYIYIIYIYTHTYIPHLGGARAVAEAVFVGETAAVPMMRYQLIKPRSKLN